MINEKNINGFTLIELSIVVIVIGIIITAIYAFSETSEKAKTKAVISEITSHRLSLSAFVDKYKYRPGDLPNANKFFKDPSSSVNIDYADTSGNGNNRWDSITERNILWAQLYHSGMSEHRAIFASTAARDTANAIPGTTRPLSKISGAGWTYLDSITVDTGANAKVFFNVLRIGGADGNETLSSAVVDINVHRYIDNKIDIPDTPKSGNYVVGETSCMKFNTDTSSYDDDFATSENHKCTGNYAEIQNVATFSP